MCDFKIQLKQKIENIESILESYLPAENGLQKTVMEAMNYSVRVGGKRLRPMLMQETYKLFGGKGTVVEPFMAAIEMIHTYSLVHDDLPAMDNDEYRRGKKSTHAAFGEAMGILAGDALLNFAFETALKAYDVEESPNVVKALRVLAEKAGIFGMIGGQVVDIESENKEIEMETLQFIHKNKTGALIEASMMVGAILGNASAEEVEKVRSIALDVGLAFQIQDDILDVVGSAELLGKPVGSDDKNGKTTYVTLLGLENAKREVESISQRAIEMLDTLSGKNEFLRELILMLVSREF